jgi:hypothetical protein
MPIIPAIWEVEIGGYGFEASLGKKLARLKLKPGMLEHSCNPSYAKGGGRRTVLGDQPGQTA